MLDGAVSFLIGEDISTRATRRFPNGAAQHAPPFRVVSETASFPNAYTSASLEAAVAEVAMPTAQRTLPPNDPTARDESRTAAAIRDGLAPGPDPLRPEDDYACVEISSRRSSV